MPDACEYSRCVCVCVCIGQLDNHHYSKPIKISKSAQKLEISDLYIYMASSLHLTRDFLHHVARTPTSAYSQVHDPLNDCSNALQTRSCKVASSCIGPAVSCPQCNQYGPCQHTTLNSQQQKHPYSRLLLPIEAYPTLGKYSTNTLRSLHSLLTVYHHYDAACFVWPQPIVSQHGQFIQGQASSLPGSPYYWYSLHLPTYSV